MDINDYIAVIEDKKGLNIKAIELKDKNYLADFIIICEGTSKPHIETIAGELIYRMKKKNNPALSAEGLKTEWALVDFGNVIVNIFTSRSRERYNIDGLWN